MQILVLKDIATVMQSNRTGIHHRQDLRSFHTRSCGQNRIGRCFLGGERVQGPVALRVRPVGEVARGVLAPGDAFRVFLPSDVALRVPRSELCTACRLSVQPLRCGAADIGLPHA